MVQRLFAVVSHLCFRYVVRDPLYGALMLIIFSRSLALLQSTKPLPSFPNTASHVLRDGNSLANRHRNLAKRKTEGITV
jgi:hypothetical protein